MESVVNRLMEAKKKRSIDSWLKSKDRLMSLDYFPKNKKRHERSMKARDCGRLFGMPECDVLWVRLLEVMKIGEKVLNADCESKEG